jgi:ABC-type Na+ efflux pump permease subunit
MEKIQISFITLIVSLLLFLGVGILIGYTLKDKKQENQIILKYNERSQIIRSMPSDSVVLEFNRVFPTK